MSDINCIVKAISAALPKRRPIGHHEPCFNGAEIAAVNRCLENGIFTNNPVREFEERLSEVCGVDHVVAVSSGTAALHLALLSVGVKSGDEVIVPSLTFVATANAVVHAGAVPHFIDCPLTIGAFKLRQYLSLETKHSPDGRGRINPKTGRTISAVVAVDLLGFPADMHALQAVCLAFNLALVEDAAQALGSRIDNAMCGTFGQVGVLSFNNNKIVTANGGGVVLTFDVEIADRARKLATTARLPHPYKVEHDDVAFNYRMGGMNAAFGTAQLARLDEFLEAKRNICIRYRDAIVHLSGIRMCDDPPAGRTSGRLGNNWLASLTVEESAGELLEALHAEGILARAMFRPLHTLPMYRDNPRSDPAMLMTENSAKKIVCLPSGVGLA